ncbi:MAG: hypothetical protein ABIN48_14420 [Ginsengibacter sp.]
MDLKTQLLKVHNKANCHLIVEWIGDNQEKFNELMDFLLFGDYQLAQRASWPMSYAAIKNPILIKSYLGKIVEFIKREDIHTGIKRNTLNVLLNIPIPEEVEGEILNLCFQFISLPEVPIGIKYYSLGLIEKLAEKYPEILSELKIILEDQYSFQSQSVIKKAAGVLKRPYK